MRFRHFDLLRTFLEAARFDNLTQAADALGLTKGAVSYQIRTLEEALGFAVFHRQARGIELTENGAALLSTAQAAMTSVESRIEELRDRHTETVTVGMATYFASRWLSPRLMSFMEAHPEIRLRLQPEIDLYDLTDLGLDLAIRWGDGRWSDARSEKLFACPAFAVGAPQAARTVGELGLEAAIAELRLLHDRDGSHAWRNWYRSVGIRFEERAEPLVVPDPNVRAEAVAAGQGIGLYDDLLRAELISGRVVRLSDHQLDDYGYFLISSPTAMERAGVRAFADWLRAESKDWSSQSL